MRIRQKIFFGYLAIALLVEVVGIVSTRAILQMEQEFDHVVERVIPLRDELERLKEAVSRVTKSSIEIALVAAAQEPGVTTTGIEQTILAKAKQEEVVREKKEIQIARLDYEQFKQRYRELIKSCTRSRELFGEIEQQGDKVLNEASALVVLANTNVSKTTVLAEEEALEAMRDDYFSIVNRAIAERNHELMRIKSLSQEKFITVSRLIFGIGLLAFLLSVLLGGSISVSIARSLSQIKSAALRVGKGKLNTQIDRYRNDEIGELAQTFNRMTRNLRQITAYAIKVRESMVESLIVLQPESLTIHSVNLATAKLLQYHRKELLGQPIRIVAPGVEKLLQGENLAQLTQQGYIQNIETTYRTRSGHSVPVLFSASLMRTEDNKTLGIVCVAQDITEQQQAAVELQRSLALVQATLEATADGILVVNRDGRIEGFNQKFVEMWQIPTEIANGQHNHSPLLQFVLNQLRDPQGFLAKVQSLYAQPEATSHDVLEFKDGRRFERYSQPQRLNGEIVGRVWSFRDVTERHRQESIIRYQATHDLLTGLPNRILFNERLSTMLSEAAENNSKLAVFFLDLDRFKIINDTLGHAAGDRLLQEVSRRVTGCLQQTDMVARWAGDEFTLLFTDLKSSKDAVAIARKILDVMRPQVDLNSHLLHVSSSIGIAIYPDDGTDAETLLKNADAALYRAKEGGRNRYQLFTPTLNSEASERLRLENQLHQALERQELVLYYQPRINVHTGTITHMEALVRWQHPEMGLVPPYKFIPLAEETGLILPLGAWVLQTACAQNRTWQDSGLPPVKVAVNLSAYQFQQPNLTELIHMVLVETQLPPDYLELEITETAVMKNVERAKLLLDHIHQLGVSIALDDFGTGYSSLSYLKEFPFQTLKIDRSFVRDINTDPNDKAIVAAIIAMGRVLNLELVAEGVENEVQEYLLRSLGCDNMQGFWFSQPLPADQATQMLRRGQGCRMQTPLSA